MLISITTGKGGAGKTTLTTLAMTCIFSRHNHSVAVVDIDPQHTLVKKRQREVDEAKEASQNSSLFKTIYENVQQKGEPYAKVYQLGLYDDFSTIKKKLEFLDNEYDIVFVDFPGSLELHDNTLRILTMLDVIFVPLYVDENNLDSTTVFIKSIMKLNKTGKCKADLRIFFNRYTDGERQKNASEFRRVKESLLKAEWPLMENHVYEDVAHERYHTIIPPRFSIFKKNIHNWAEELYEICIGKKEVEQK